MPLRTGPTRHPRPAVLPVLLLLSLLLPALVVTAAPASAERAGTTVYRVAADSLATGNDHACAILDGGSMRCWGNNPWGQLGLGHTTRIGDDEHPSAYPPVSLGAGRKATAITAGSVHTCALLDNGSVRCWGAGFNGRLGVASTSHYGDDEPASAAPTVTLDRPAVAVSAGNSHTCAILDNGSVRCWGYGHAGRLGTGSTLSIGDDERVDSVPPVDLGAGRTAVAISAGAQHTCAILDDGSLRCWGANDRGQLGLGHEEAIGNNEQVSDAPVVPLGIGRSVVAVAAGGESTCVILDNQELRCWGYGGKGQLGNGLGIADLGDDEAITTAPALYLGPGRHAVAVAVSEVNACAVLDSGALRCWGDNSSGQTVTNDPVLGDDEPAWLASTVPLGGRSVRAVDTGASYVCATLDDATLRCWGNNASGQLGLAMTATVGDDEVPTAYPPVSLGGRVRLMAGTPTPDATPTALKVTAKPKRDRKHPYATTISGSVVGTLPAGSCSGTVTLSATGKVRAVKVGKAKSRKKVAVRGTRVVVLRDTATGCRFQGRLKIKPRSKAFAKRDLAGKVTVAAVFAGNDRLRSSTTTVRVRLG